MINCCKGHIEEEVIDQTDSFYVCLNCGSLSRGFKSDECLEEGQTVTHGGE